MEQLHDRDPKSIGPYEVVALLGSGGMGKVYLCTSPGGARLAVKVIRPERADDAHYRARFRREVACARLVHSSVTAEVIDADTDSETLWLATAYLDAPTLTKQVEQSPLDEPDLRRLAFALAEALQVIHGVGLVHRDLKPSNIIMAADGPKVIDFGIALAADATALTTTNQLGLGSAGYVAPERISSGATGPEADIFALGAVLAYAATGREPFGGGLPELVLFRIRNDEPNLDGVPPGLRSLIAACLAKDPGQRPTTSAILQGFSDAAPPPMPTQALPVEPALPEAGHAPTLPVVVATTLLARTQIASQPVDVPTRLLTPEGLPGRGMPRFRPISPQPVAVSVRRGTLPRPVAPQPEDVATRRVTVQRPVPGTGTSRQRRPGRKWLRLAGGSLAAAVTVAGAVVALAIAGPSDIVTGAAPGPELTTTSVAPPPTSEAPPPVTRSEPATTPSPSTKRTSVLVGYWPSSGGGELRITAEGSIDAWYFTYSEPGPYAHLCDELNPGQPCDAVWNVTLHITKLIQSKGDSSLIDGHTQSETATATAIVDTSTDPEVLRGSRQTFKLKNDVISWAVVTSKPISTTFCRTTALLGKGTCG